MPGRWWFSTERTLARTRPRSTSPGARATQARGGRRARGRTPDEISAAFAALQAELDEQIRTRMDEARKTLFERFDEDVHERLRLRLEDARAQLDRVGRRFWLLTRFMLEDRARFDDATLSF